MSTAANVTVTKKPKESAVEIAAEIPVESLARFRAKAVKELSQEVSIDGFRKGGNVPENILARHVGEAAILERTASIAISDELPLILAKERIAAIERPNVTVTKLAPGNPIAFKATVSVFPEVTLPDYMKIAKKHKAPADEAVSDDELSDMTRFLRRERARIERVEAGVKPEEAHEEAQKLGEKDLPPLDEEFAKALGAAGVEELTARMRDNMANDKKRRAVEKVRIEMIEDIISKTDLTLPAILIEHELDRMMNRMAHDIEHAGSSLADYLKSTGKTEDDIRNEWRESAEKRAKMNVVVHEIALKEGIKPSEEDIVRELTIVKRHQEEHHGQRIDEADLRMRITEALLPDAVFRFLENS